jgi:hypothetical protein
MEVLLLVLAVLDVSVLVFAVLALALILVTEEICVKLEFVTLLPITKEAVSILL